MAGACLVPTYAVIDPTFTLSARDLAIGSSASPSSLTLDAETGFLPPTEVEGGFMAGVVFFSSSYILGALAV